MSESTQTPPGSRKKKLLVAAIGAAAVCVLSTATVVGVNASNSKTEQLCTEAATVSQDTAKAVKTSGSKAAEVRTHADRTEGYADREGTAVLLKAVDTAETDVANIVLDGDCDSRDTAESIQDKSAAAKKHATKLAAATKTLTDDLTAFQTGAKRAADEKAAAEAADKAEEAMKAEEAQAAEAALAEQAVANQAAAPAPAAQPQYSGDATTYAPAPQTPSYEYAPAPYVPVPAPAPVPAWTPPPPGSGPGGPVCLGIGDTVFCTGD